MTEAIAGTVPVSFASRLGYTLALIGAGLMILAALVNRLGIADIGITIPAFGIGALVALMGVALGLFGVARGWFSPAVVGGSKGWLAILIGVAAIGITFLIVSGGLTAPPVHDVTTAPDDPPEFVSLYDVHYAGREYDSFAAYDASRENLDIAGAYPDLKTLTFEQSVNEVFQAAEAATQSMGWEVAAVVPEEGRIEATATTPLFGYKDDVVIRVRTGADDQTELDIRSASRVGEGDLGANANRIRAFTKALNNALN
ncbi:MAG: DUF1499 domain-containing protein [Alphaproteobacteria bacterium]